MTICLRFCIFKRVDQCVPFSLFEQVYPTREWIIKVTTSRNSSWSLQFYIVLPILWLDNRHKWTDWRNICFYRTIQTHLFYIYFRIKNFLILKCWHLFLWWSCWGFSISYHSGQLIIWIVTPVESTMERNYIVLCAAG